jgi:hypothetical protein
MSLHFHFWETPSPDGAMTSLQELPEEMQFLSKTRQRALACRVVGRVEAIAELPENKARRAIPNTIAEASPIS